MYYTFLFLFLFLTVVAIWYFGAFRSQRNQNDRKEAKNEVSTVEVTVEFGNHDDLKKIAAYEERQREILTKVESCLSSAETAGTQIRTHIRDAETALSRAELQFNEGAFAPFWDAIEGAVVSLAKAETGIDIIIQHGRTYCSEISELDSAPPPFRVGLDTVLNTTPAATRMHALVRSAQKNFQFSVIYEQRRTNKILVTGFTSLEDALREMSSRLEDSIDELSDALSDIAESGKADTRELIASVRKLDERASRDSATQLEMLDNIQRKRRPRRVYPKTFD